MPGTHHLNSTACTAVSSIRAASVSGSVPGAPRPDAPAANGVSQRDALDRAWFLVLLSSSFLGQNLMWMCIMTELGHRPASQLQKKVGV